MTERRRARLQRDWVLCAIAAAGARFVPVPLLDDIIGERALRSAVERTWSAHDRPVCPQAIDVLCNETHGFGHRVATTAARLPVTLLVYPVRKVARYVTAVRGVWRDLAEVLLLARAVDRCLASGWFAATDQAELVRQARLVRRAHQQSVRSSDLRVLDHSLRAALLRVRGLRGPAERFARRSFGDLAARGGPGELPVGPGDERVEAGADQVQVVLDRAEVAGVLVQLDERFDSALRRLTPA